jgi:hypothetical protein
MPAEIHVDDVGTAIRLHLVDQDGRDLNVSGASAIEVVLVSPASKRLAVQGSLSSTGLDGRIQYVTAAGDLDVAGTWRLQARVTLGSAHWSSNVVRFQVTGNI